MRCSDFKELLSAYANDELSRTQKEFIEGHLSGCDSCRKLLSEYIKVKHEVGQLRDWSPFPDFSRDIMLRIEGNKNSSKTNNGNRKNIANGVFYQRRWLSASLAFALVLSLFLGWFFISDNAGKVQAKEIVLQDTGIQTLLDGYNPDDVKFSVENAGNGHKFVAILSDTDMFIVAEVDTSTSEVVELYVLVLDNEFKQRIMNLAGSSEEVQSLLEQGAVFTGFKVNYIVLSLNYIDNSGKWQHSETFHFSVNIRMDLNTEQWWYIHLNLDTNDVSVSSAEVLPGYHGYKMFSAIMAYIVMAAAIAGIIGAVKDKKPALIFVKILPPALFAWGIYIFFFNPILIDAAVFAVILILLVLGVISGIAGIKKSTSKKGKALSIAGIILCLIFTAMIISYFTQNSNYGFIPFYPMEIVIID